MKKLNLSFNYSHLVLGSVSMALFVGCIDPNAGSYPPSYPSSYGTGYGNGYGAGYGDPYYHERRDIDRQRRDADRERQDLEEERRRVESERRRIEEERARQYNPPPPRREESCPSGFSPSENKCSREERQRGCRDMRLPGGLGCVSR